ncbi:MAG: hypothetical protein Q4G69_05180, partial [Planctomycetia bacterium]|nr:hypothetical protein [Planctomycetia bacterium]
MKHSVFGIRTVFSPLTVLFLMYLISVSAGAAESGISNITPEEAYRQLVAGNARYTKQEKEGALKLPELSKSEDRLPIATILYSSDLPKKPNELMDLSEKDLYMAPLSLGAFSGDDLDDLEYGTMNLKTPVVVVLTHYPSRDVLNFIRQFDLLEAKAKEAAKNYDPSKSPAKKETDKDVELYNLVGPAVKRAREAYPDLKAAELANVVSEAIVWQSLEAVLMQSTATQDLIKAGSVDLIAAMVDDSTGQISWLGAHPLQEEFLKPAPKEVENKLTAMQTVKTAKPVENAGLPEPLTEKVVSNYITEYKTNNYYSDIVSDYYTTPVYYEPCWRLFHPTVWCYRPWCGVWVNPFVPYPYYRPWGYGPGIGLYFGRGWFNFGIGFNFHYGPPVHFGPGFHPHDPYWGRGPFRPAPFGPGHGPGPRPGFGPGPGPHMDRARELIYSGRGREIGALSRGDRPGFRPGSIQPGMVSGFSGNIGGPRPGKPGGPGSLGPGSRTPGQSGAPGIERGQRVYKPGGMRPIGPGSSSSGRNLSTGTLGGKATGDQRSTPSGFRAGTSPLGGGNPGTTGIRAGTSPVGGRSGIGQPGGPSTRGGSSPLSPSSRPGFNSGPRSGLAPSGGRSSETRWQPGGFGQKELTGNRGSITEKSSPILGNTFGSPSYRPSSGRTSATYSPNRNSGSDRAPASRPGQGADSIRYRPSSSRPSATFSPSRTSPSERTNRNFNTPSRSDTPTRNFNTPSRISTPRAG